MAHGPGWEIMGDVAEYDLFIIIFVLFMADSAFVIVQMGSSRSGGDSVRLAAERNGVVSVNGILWMK